jgi:hypothetical protein
MPSELCGRSLPPPRWGLLLPAAFEGSGEADEDAAVLEYVWAP